MEKIGLILCILFLCTVSSAKVKDISNYMDFASKEERADLLKLLQQIQLIPAKDPESGLAVLKVERLEKGSIYDRMGLKVGDLVQMSNGTTQDKKMEIKQPLRKNK